MRNVISNVQSSSYLIVDTRFTDNINTSVNIRVGVNLNADVNILLTSVCQIYSTANNGK